MTKAVEEKGHLSCWKRPQRRSTRTTPLRSVSGLRTAYGKAVPLRPNVMDSLPWPRGHLKRFHYETGLIVAQGGSLPHSSRFICASLPANRTNADIVHVKNNQLADHQKSRKSRQQGEHRQIAWPCSTSRPSPNKLSLACDVRCPSRKATLCDRRARVYMYTTTRRPAGSYGPVAATSIHFELPTNRRPSSR